MIWWYIPSVIVCLAVFLWSHWYDGHNLKLPDLAILTLFSALPLINLFILGLWALIMLETWVNKTQFRVLIKGRNRHG